jgi:hypothetical protein
MFAVEKPLPLANEDTAEYWEACKRGELRMQTCDGCGHVRFPPAVVCPRCLSEAFTWERMSGRGRVYTWIVVHRPQHPAFYEDVPYNVAIVELDEGPRLLANIIGTPPDAIRCDMRVRVVFEERGDQTIPQFAVAP